jgi:hypothetical protein
MAVFQKCSAEWGGDANCHRHSAAGGVACTTTTGRKKSLENASGAPASVLVFISSMSADGGAARKFEEFFREGRVELLENGESPVLPVKPIDLSVDSPPAA